ncbi:MAG TPA: hypothetical protein ENJ95_13805 [Bacteroidetes bacterium]|nr:hypothetical protein [Bacteroidota bacterium]
MEENFGTDNKNKARFRAAMTFLILFILPAGSWYFMSSGLNYRKKSQSELSDMGKVGAFEMKNQTNLTISPELLKGKVAVVNFISKDIATAKKQVARIAKVHQSFDNTEDVVFLSFTLPDTANNLLVRANKLGITDNKQWYLISTGTEDLTYISKKLFHIDNPESGVALIDTSMSIRRVYDINSNKEMGRLVEQIAIVIPEQPRRGM